MMGAEKERLLIRLFPLLLHIIPSPMGGIFDIPSLHGAGEELKLQKIL